MTSTNAAHENAVVKRGRVDSGGRGVEADNDATMDNAGSDVGLKADVGAVAGLKADVGAVAGEEDAAVTGDQPPSPLARLEADLRACNGACAKHLLDQDVFERAFDHDADFLGCFQARYGEPPEQCMALCRPGSDAPVALVGISKDHLLVLTASGDVHGFPCTAATEEEQALMNRHWGLRDMAALNQPERLGKMQLDGFVKRLYGTSCPIDDELVGAGRGISKVTMMEPDRVGPMKALFDGCALEAPGGNLCFFHVHSLERISNLVPSVAMAMNPATGKFCALSRGGHLIQGDFNVVGPRAFKSDWSADVLMQEAMAEYWSPRANKQFTDLMCVLENKFSLLRVRASPDADEPAYVISNMDDATKFFGLIPVWKLNAKHQLERVNLVSHWRTNCAPRMVERMFFDPSKPPLLNGSNFNLFRGWSCRPVPPADRSKPCPLIMELFLDVYCQGGQKLLNFFLDCLAYKFQRPGEKLGVCIVLRGGMGTGKSSFIEILREICGAHVMETSSIDRLTGRFNSHLADKMFLALNEAFFAGNHKDAAIIKSFISEDRMMLEPKFVNAQEMRVSCDLIMTTNAKWVVQAARENRRYLILDTSGRKPKAFYDALHANRAREAGELFWSSLNRRLPDGFNPSRHLQEMTPTRGAVDQLLQGQQGTIINLFLEQLKAGEWTLETIRGFPAPFIAAEPVKVETQRLLEGFQNLIRTNQALTRYGDNEELDVKFTQMTTVNMLTRNLNKLFGKDVIKSDRGEYQIPAAAVLRSAFAKVTLGDAEYDWTEDQ